MMDDPNGWSVTPRARWTGWGRGGSDEPGPQSHGSCPVLRVDGFVATVLP